MKINLGAFVTHWRTQKGLGVEELASGIMDRSTLSRFESGQIMTSKENLEAIFSRLGINPNSIVSIFLDEGVAATEKIKAELDYYLVHGKTEKARELISKLETNSKFMKNKFNVQHLLAANAANAINSGDSPGVIMKILDQAISTVWHNFIECKVRDYQLTHTDLKILNMKAITLFDLGEKDRSIALLFALKENVDTRMLDNEERGKRLPQIIYHLTMYLSQVAKHKEEYRQINDICEHGLKVCISTGHLTFMPSILMVKADSRFFLGDEEGCRKLLVQSYHIFEACERYEEMSTIKSYVAEKNLGIAF